MSAIDMTGQVSGRWTVLERAENRGGTAMWLCECECGSISTIQGGHLRSGHSRSCGCLKRELAAERHTTHGMVNSPEYSSWKAMKQRCLNPNDISFENYGRRGITVCDRWLASFENFYEDMGDRPEGTSIDRIDSSGNYEPGNCRWATAKQQANNRRSCRFLEYLGMKWTVAQWSAIAVMKNETFQGRINRGWNIQKSLLTPVQ